MFFLAKKEFYFQTTKVLVTGLILFFSSVLTAGEKTEVDGSLFKLVQTLSDDLTLGELRKQCNELVDQSNLLKKVKSSAIVNRKLSEQQVENIPFGIVPHRPNYAIISGNINKPNEAPFQETYPEENFSFQRPEIKYQISLKFPAAKDLFVNNLNLYFGFTLRSFWQAFNGDISSPFRDNNYEPEVWLTLKNNWELFGLTHRVIRLGAVHQSNGRSGPLSRSWNRIYAEFIFEYDNYYSSFKPWWRIKEEEDNDDNPDITDYLGSFEWLNVYKQQDQTFSLLLRNNLNKENKGAFQLDWSFPVKGHLRGYVQWFNGYGESLIDYNAHVNSIGIGVQITDWL